jgi:hypothetical protein
VSKRSLCLKDTAVLTEVTPFVPQLNPMNRYTLALIYLPENSVLNGCHLDNQTSRLVIEPILGKSYYTVEFIGLSIPDNKWVDKYQVKRNCNSADSWMVQDYVDHVSMTRRFSERSEKTQTLTKTWIAKTQRVAAATPSKSKREL